jgi:hypothetical protein
VRQYQEQLQQLDAEGAQCSSWWQAAPNAWPLLLLLLLVLLLHRLLGSSCVHDVT